MRKSIAVFILAAFIVFPAAALAQPITYDLIPAAVNANYILTGSITTDGTIGTLASGNIVSWSLDLRETVAPFLNITANNGQHRTFQGTITATPSALSIPFVATPIGPFPLDGGMLTLGNINQDVMNVSFQTAVGSSTNGVVTTWAAFTTVEDLSLQLAGGVQNFYASSPLPPPFIFATAPEPSSVVLAFLAAAGLAIVAIRKRRTR